MNVHDLHDLIRLLEQHPEWLTELRRLVLTDELLELPGLVRQLIEADQRIMERIAELVAVQQVLVETQRQHSQEIRELREIAQQNTEAIRELRATVQQHSQEIRELREIAQQNTEAIRELQVATQRNTEAIRELQVATQRNTEAIRELQVATQRNTEAIARLTEIQQQHSEAINRLTQTQERHSEAINRLTQTQEHQSKELRELQRTVAELSKDVRSFLEWQRGEAGRREGEQYERRILARAVNLFYGGDGGSPSESHVRRRVAQWLRPLYQSDSLPDPPADPVEADLIWWKGSKVMVVEVSLKVNGQDIRRARQRADTLRSLALDAIPVVIGEEWATPDARTTAEQESVEWKVGDDLSEGFKSIRRLPDGEGEPAHESR
jgi:predicted  nucleic acid-binding Zn-ribbon protein